jgi:hypothetical protein
MTTASPYAGGYLGPNPIEQQAPGNFGQNSQIPGDSMPKDKKFSEEEKQVRERARKAGRIYRQVCEDLRLDACFFSNFGEWTEYVEGRMSDDEFHGRAVSLAHRMMAEAN